MPTYEYRCNACGKNFEYQQRMTDDDLVTCEACGEPKLEKLISTGGGFVLKGSGWYRDLYGSPPAQSTDTSKPPEAEAKSEGKSESRGESKGDSGSKTSEWSDTRTVSEAKSSGSGSGSGSSGSGSSGSGSSGGSGGGSGSGSSTPSGST